MFEKFKHPFKESFYLFIFLWQSPPPNAKACLEYVGCRRDSSDLLRTLKAPEIMALQDKNALVEVIWAAKLKL